MPTDEDLLSEIIVDELPEVSIDTEPELRSFLENYRHSMNVVLDEQLGWNSPGYASDRCGATAVLVMRALHEKARVVGLTDIGVHKLNFEASDEQDTEGMRLAQEAITGIAAETGQSTEDIRHAITDLGRISDYWNDIKRGEPDVTIDDPRVQDFSAEVVGQYAESQAVMVQKILEFYKSIRESNPDALSSILRYVESGSSGGHIVVLLDILFADDVKPRRLVIDANSEQFGDAFDNLYLFSLEDAMSQGYTLNQKDYPETKIGAALLGGDIEKLTKVPVKSSAKVNAFHIESERIPLAEVSHLIAEEYRRDNP